MKMDNTPRHAWSNGRLVVLILVAALLVSLPAGLCLAAKGDPPRFFGSGELTSYGEGSVTISTVGYGLHPGLIVEDLRGKPTTLAAMPMPVYVNFQYIYIQRAPRTMTPAIVYIKATPRPPEPRNRRSTR